MSALGRIAERLTARRWTVQDAEAMVGPFESCALAHATDETVRDNAASGGAVTALLGALLDAGTIDGALVCATSVEREGVRARYHVATTAEDLREAQGSTYVLGDFTGEALPLVESFDGTLAVVALPCEIEILSRREALDAKVALTVALFCGHATRPELADALVAKLAAEEGTDAPLEAFRFRRGHWRGRLTARFADGTVAERPFSSYGLFQNLYLFSAKKCLFCGDHFGYAADICAGDVWSYRLQDDPIKHTAIVAKTSRGSEALAAAKAGGALDARETGIDLVLDGQRRIAPFHHNVSARSRAGAKLGMRIPDPGLPVRWHEYLAARVAIRNYQRTEDPASVDAVLSRSRILWKLQLWWLKGLESLS